MEELHKKLPNGIQKQGDISAVPLKESSSEARRRLEATKQTEAGENIKRLHSEISESFQRKTGRPFESASTTEKVHAIMDCLFTLFWNPELRKYLSIWPPKGENMRAHVKTLTEQYGDRLDKIVEWVDAKDDRLIKDESGKPFWFPKPAGESYKTELLSEDDKKQAAALKKISKSPYAKRTAEEILEHGLLAGTGCTDYTTVFVSLCRHSGIPVKHVLTVSADWLNLPNDDKQDPHTHSFTRVYDKETSKWKLYDPKWWKNPNYRDFYSGRDEGGLDSHVHADGEKFVYYGEDDNLWGMGMRSSKELREVLQGFRREYKAQRKE